jgi:mRNA-degrading endonuclease RelE of RelBE toxin-antitoxin system
MVDKIIKFVRQLTPKQKKQVQYVMQQIRRDHTTWLQIKKLVGRKNLYRVRILSIRLVYTVRGDVYEIVDIDYRWSVYKNLS